MRMKSDDQPIVITTIPDRGLKVNQIAGCRICLRKAYHWIVPDNKPHMGPIMSVSEKINGMLYAKVTITRCISIQMIAKPATFHTIHSDLSTWGLFNRIACHWISPTAAPAIDPLRTIIARKLIEIGHPPKIIIHKLIAPPMP